MFSVLARLLGNALLIPIFAIASIIPKNKKLWIFGAWNGVKYLDNPKYIYKYILDNRKDIEAIWISKSKLLCEEMKRKNLPVCYAFSIRGLWVQARAAVAIYTHTVSWEFVPAVIGYSTKRIQTWHGMPIKKIGFDDLRAGNMRFKARIRSIVNPHLSERCDLVIAGGHADQQRYRSAFEVRPENVVITGYPRNDEIYKSMMRAGSDRRRKVIYMPTFRGEVGSEFPLLSQAGFDFDIVNDKLKKLDIDLYIKLHPVQVFSPADIELIEKASNIHAVMNDGDIYESIGEYEMLITDYSGIYFDYMVTGRPIIMAPFDLAEYKKKDRDLYYTYEEICPTPPCFTWKEVLDRVENGINQDCSIRYRELQHQFLVFLDEKSAQRSVEKISEIVM